MTAEQVIQDVDACTNSKHKHCCMPQNSMPDTESESPAILAEPSNSILFQSPALLPSDATSVEFKNAIRGLRQHHPERILYNCMICDQLAMRGIHPNGANVLDTGQWGTRSDVVADVRAWYAALAKRLTPQYAAIPEAFRRSANQLLEQMWALSLDAANEPLACMKSELEETHSHIQSLQEQVHNLQLALEQAQLQSAQELEQHAAALAHAGEQLNDAHTRIEQEQSVCAQLRLGIANFESSIATQALDHQRALREQAQQNASEIRLLTEASAKERTDLILAHESSLRAMQGKLTELQSRLEESMRLREDQARQDARTHALSLDKARMDVREANARADSATAMAVKLREEKFDLREKISQLELDKARLERERDPRPGIAN